jgi:hypothetical protein
MMLVDIQGSLTKLTDPQFLTNVLVEGSDNYERVVFHGSGDLGKDGMDSIIGMHNCNSLCIALGIETE